MILEVHVAYLFASLAVLFGLTYSMSQFLNYKIEKMRKQSASEQKEIKEQEVLVS